MDDLAIGIDYGTRKISVAVLTPHTDLVTLQDLVLSKNDRDYELLSLSNFLEQTLEEIGLFPYWAGLSSRASIEGAILGRSLNAQVLANLGYTAGALMVTLARRGVRADFVPSSTWKKSALGNGSASKADVMAWAVETWPEANVTTQDMADALGLATHNLMAQA